MKKIVLLASLALGLFTSLKSEAQVRINVQIGAPVMQQTWYDYDDDYYYMPQQDVYYNVRRRVYVYPEGGTWVYAPALPGRYGNCSYSSVPYYRIHDRSPFNRADYYRRQYPSAYGNRGGYNNAGNNYYRHDNGRHRGWDNNGRGRDRNDYRNNGGYNNYHNRR
jgi:hypothetical protein